MASTETPGFLDTYLPYVLRRADQMLSAPFYALLNDYGVARSDWRVLAVLHEFGELPVLDLAAQALSPQPTVTHALRRLEDRKLVVRTHGTADKRQRLVSITDAGTELTQRLIDDARRLETEALADVGDLGDLINELHQLTATVEAGLRDRADQADTDQRAG